MITRTTRRIIFIALVVPPVPVPLVPPSPSSPQTVSIPQPLTSDYVTNFEPDAKQARDLVNILTESKQQIDPKLHEMARYGGGGGGGRWGGRGRGGGRGGGRKFHRALSLINTNFNNRQQLDW